MKPELDEPLTGNRVSRTGEMFLFFQGATNDGADSVRATLL